MVSFLLNRDQRDLLGLLTGELQAQLETRLSQSEADHSASACQQQATQCANYAEAAQLIGLEGLSSAWLLLQQNLSALTEETSLDTEQQQLLDTWLIYFLDYLQQLSQGELEEETALRLTAFLAQTAWPQPLTDTEPLTRSLVQITLTEEQDSGLPSVATADMLDLRLGEDLNPELFEGLMLELPNQVSRFSDYLATYVRDNDRQALAAAQRIAHTIKGSANVVGISGLANLMHFTEDLLEELARHPETHPQSLADLLSELSDTLANMLDALLEGRSQVPEALEVMQQLLDCFHQLRNTETSSDNINVPVETQQLSVEQSQATSREDMVTAQWADDSPEPKTDTDNPTTNAPVGHMQESLAQLRVPEMTAQDLLRLAGTSAISTHRLQTQITQLHQQLAQLGNLYQRLGQLTEDLGHQIEIRDFFKGRNRHNSDEMDPLELDRYSELHSFFHQLQEFTTDSRDAITVTRQQLRGLEEETYAQQQTNRDVQNLLLDMRMISAQNLEARFQRCVRQACRLIGKQARLVIEGADTRIDNQLLQALLDPIMHLLRNAVDHGLENADERLAAGKDSEGCIRLAFRNQGQSVVVTLSDDGAGLKRERILAHAKNLGLITTDITPDTISDNELQQLIFTPGFSTSDKVSQTSGRGIGLDMVADRITQLNGRVTLESETGLGCTFTMRLPMAMITEQGLLVKLGDKQLAIANRGLSQLLFLEPDDIESYDKHDYYRFGEEDITVRTLASLAPMAGTRLPDPRQAQALLLVETYPGQQLAVALEQVATSREMVIKPLSPYTPQTSGVIGATILGDGQVAPVIDLQQLVLDHLSRNDTESGTTSLLIQDKEATRPPLVIVVDDSLSTRRSLSQFVVDMGLDVASARDGFEAIELLEQRLPSLLLVDMEMPRMNGLELSSHLRARAETRHLPIIMITSRNSEKHRHLARQAGVDHYLCKPFAEDELQACINGCLEGNLLLASNNR